MDQKLWKLSRLILGFAGFLGLHIIVRGAGGRAPVIVSYAKISIISGNARYYAGRDSYRPSRTRARALRASDQIAFVAKNAGATERCRD